MCLIRSWASGRRSGSSSRLGASLEDIEARITALAPQIEHLFTVEDLDYLAKGGRVSKASAFF